METANRYSGEELHSWLNHLHKNSIQGRGAGAYTFDEDLTLCREVVKAWFENRGPCVPSLTWFDHHVAGKCPMLGKRTSLSLSHRYQNYLSLGMKSAVVAHNEQWSLVRISFSWLKEQHGLNDEANLENHDDFGVDRMLNNLLASQDGQGVR